MEGKSIAECFPRSILQYFQPSLSYTLSLSFSFVYFGFYCKSKFTGFENIITLFGIYLCILRVQKMACILISVDIFLFMMMLLISGKNSKKPRLPTVLMASIMSSGFGDFRSFKTDYKYIQKIILYLLSLLINMQYNMLSQRYHMRKKSNFLF